MLAMPNLAIHLGYHWPAGTRQPAGTMPSLPSRGLSLATAGESHRRYGVLKTSRLSVLLCRTDTHCSCRDPQMEGDLVIAVRVDVSEVAIPKFARINAELFARL